MVPETLSGKPNRPALLSVSKPPGHPAPANRRPFFIPVYFYLVLLTFFVFMVLLGGLTGIVCFIIWKWLGLPGFDS